MMLFDFGPSPVADAPARPTTAQAPARVVLTAPQAPVAPAAMPARSVTGSSPVSAALAATLFDIGAVAAAPETPAVVETPVEVQAPAQAPVPDLFVQRNVYLRAAPTNQGRALGVLNACEPLTALGTGPYGQWREVARADGVTGFVYHRFVGAEAAPGCR